MLISRRLASEPPYIHFFPYLLLYLVGWRLRLALAVWLVELIVEPLKLD